MPYSDYGIDFKAAVEELTKKGIEFEPPKIDEDFKAIFLSKTDPSGNIIRLLWRK